MFQRLHVGQPRGDVDSHVNEVVADNSGAAQLPVAREEVPNPAEANQFFNIDVDEVARRRALVELHQQHGLEVAQEPQAQAIQGSGHGREGCCEQRSTVGQVQRLMAQLHGVLEAVRIEQPPRTGSTQRRSA